jgi:hypothetical protein
VWWSGRPSRAIIPKKSLREETVPRAFLWHERSDGTEKGTPRAMAANSGPPTTTCATRRALTEGFGFWGGPSRDLVSRSRRSAITITGMELPFHPTKSPHSWADLRQSGLGHSDPARCHQSSGGRFQDRLSARIRSIGETISRGILFPPRFGDRSWEQLVFRTWRGADASNGS